MKTYNKKIGLLIRLLSLSSLSACFGTRQAMMDAPEKCSGSTSAHDAYSNLIGGMTPLGEAIINENSQMVKALVKNQKTDINNIGTNEPAIFLALRLKNSEIAMILFTESASRRLNVTYIDPDSGDTALHLAAKEGYSDVVNMLIGTDQIDVNSKK